VTRRSERPYFPEEPGVPAPLRASCTRKVRFEEVDPLGIVWHGRYPSYLEDGRTAFGERYGIGYLDMAKNQYLGPIVSRHLDYHTPLEFGQSMTIETAAHYTNAVKLLFSYRILGPDGRVACTAYTIQLLLGLDKKLLVAFPEHLDRFRLGWREGKLK